MATSSSHRVFAANIPSITALRNELDYGDARLPRCAAFYDDTRAFRKKFITSRGVAGTELHDWRSRDGQAALTEMTLAYLDKEGNGSLFWPDDKSSDKYNKYQYSKDHTRIKRLVKQLFFRLNQQQFRNKKYKHKTGPSNKPTDNRGNSEATAIDVDAVEVQSISVSEPSPTDASRFEQPHSEPYSSPYQVILDDADVYAVPPSPPRMRQFESVNQPSKVRHGPSCADEFAQDRPSKRRKMQRTSSACPSVTGSTGQTWTSPRVKRTVRREGYHGLDVLNEFIDFALLGPSAGLDTSDFPQQESSPAVSTITVKAPPDSDIIDSARPDESTDPRSLPALEPPPSPPRSNTGNENDLDQDQARFQAVHATLAPSHPEHSRDSENVYEHPKLPLLHPSASPTLDRAGSVGRVRGEGGSEAKFSIDFIYRVVLSRTPKTVTERWTPQGRFQDKTLAELRKELPFDDGESQGLIFTIDSPCMKTIERILNDDEGGFLSLKGYINREIKEWLSRQRRLEVESKLRVLVDILIEQMSDEKKQEWDSVEDLELQW
ncbi:hypothetical protein VTI74DRAFT_279 [Chaetomium olivicolor]